MHSSLTLLNYEQATAMRILPMVSTLVTCTPVATTHVTEVIVFFSKISNLCHILTVTIHHHSHHDLKRGKAYLVPNSVC